MSDAHDNPPSLFAYGTDGAWLGAQVGLAAGYLATGDEYDRREWRTLVFGAGVGAIVGAGTGLTLGFMDLGQPAPGAGWIILRDTGYGTGLGALVGVAVGALVMLDSGDTKDLLTGTAYGGVIGAGTGVVFGSIEAATMERDTPQAAAPRLRFVRSAKEVQIGSRPPRSCKFTYPPRDDSPGANPEPSWPRRCLGPLRRQRGGGCGRPA